MPYKDNEKRKEKAREYARKYYQENPEKHIQRVKDYQQRNKEKVRQYRKDYYQKNKERKKRENRERYRKLREKIKEILGNRCIICNSTKKILYHEIHGKKHFSGFNQYILRHIKDFVPICKTCHIAIHNLAKSKKISWKKLMELVKWIR